jgi:hypothetical protein
LLLFDKHISVKFRINRAGTTEAQQYAPWQHDDLAAMQVSGMQRMFEALTPQLRIEHDKPKGHPMP